MTNRRLSLSLSVLLLAMICFASPAFAAKKKNVMPVEMDYASLVEKVLPSVVRITTDKSSGSGFFVSDKGEILTNYHIINGAREILVTTSEGFTAKALVKDTDEAGDMALLVINARKKTPYLNISKTLPKQGEAVMAVGNPQGFEGTVSNGIISAFRQNKRWIQFTAPVSHGSSGGALVNSSGEVIGMPTLQYKEGQNLNFAIASNVLREFFNTAKNKTISLAEADFDPIKELHIQADEGIAESQYFLGVAYYTGAITVNDVAIPQDKSRALYWFYKAAEQGHTLAQSKLTSMYYLGTVAAKDYVKAAYWGIRAAGNGDAESQYILGLMYAKARGFKKDYQQARYWYLKAAEQGYTDAQVNLGVMYHEGEGVKKDYKQCLYWYRKAAEQGNDLAQLYLGYMYEDGEGVKSDMKQAVTWYRKSAKQGNQDARNILAKMGIYDY